MKKKKDPPNLSHFSPQRENEKKKYPSFVEGEIITSIAIIIGVVVDVVVVGMS